MLFQFLGGGGFVFLVWQLFVFLWTVHLAYFDSHLPFAFQHKKVPFLVMVLRSDGFGTGSLTGSSNRSNPNLIDIV